MGGADVADAFSDGLWSGKAASIYLGPDRRRCLYSSNRMADFGTLFVVENSSHAKLGNNRVGGRIHLLRRSGSDSLVRAICGFSWAIPAKDGSGGEAHTETMAS